MGIKISFDFDGTLSKGEVQKFCKKLMRKGYEIWITTSRSHRYDDRDNDLFQVADKLRIQRDRITFTGNYRSKAEWLLSKDFICHIDDDSYELDAISNNYSTTGVCVKSPTWKDYVLTLINLQS